MLHLSNHPCIPLPAVLHKTYRDIVVLVETETLLGIIGPRGLVVDVLMLNMEPVFLPLPLLEELLLC